MTQFVVKVASRCNIACSYCYMYFRGDDSSLKRPKRLSDEHVNVLFERIQEHKTATGDSISIALHGGEPLLFGKQRARHFLDRAAACCCKCSIQTNGILLDSEWLKILAEHDVTIGISLDGPRAINDKSRIDHRGHSTFDRTLRSVELVMGKGRSVGSRFGGIISVLDDPTSDPCAYYELVKSLGVPSFNVLLPDVDHENYWRYNKFEPKAYGSYLTRLFDLWFEDKNAPANRFFEAIVSKIVGGNSPSESIGSFGAPSIIVETDGSLQAHDVARMNIPHHAYGFTLNNCSIQDFIGRDPIYQSCSRDSFVMDDVECLKCPIFHVCQAGFWSHRFSANRGYENPSVYCDALFEIVTHIHFALMTRSSLRRPPAVVLDGGVIEAHVASM